MATIIQTKWDESNSIATDNINTWNLFNTIIVENDIIEISLTSKINLSLKVPDGDYIYRSNIVAGKYSSTGELESITDINIKSALYYKPIGITFEDIPSNSYGTVTVLGKITNLQGSIYNNIISDGYTYSPLFVNDTGKFVNIEGVNDILLDDTNYLICSGLKLNVNEIYFYPDESPVLVSEFNDPTVITSSYFIGETIARGDVLHLDIDTETVYVAAMDLERYNIIGVCNKAFAASTTKQPVEYIRKGLISDFILDLGGSLVANPNFPSFDPDDLDLTQQVYAPVYLGNSTDTYQLSIDSAQSYGIFVVGWLNNIDGYFYLNPYPVNISTTLSPKKNITLSIPARNINYMAGDDSILIYDLELSADETMVFLESQLNHSELSGISVLDVRVYGRIEGWNAEKDYDWPITYKQASTPSGASANQYWWNNTTDIIKRYDGTVWTVSTPISVAPDNTIIFDNTTNRYYTYVAGSWVLTDDDDIPDEYTLQTINLFLSQYQEYEKDNSITGPAKIYVKMYNKYGADVITNGYISLLMLKN